jgi:hypothetical protein
MTHNQAVSIINFAGVSVASMRRVSFGEHIRMGKGAASPRLPNRYRTGGEAVREANGYALSLHPGLIGYTATIEFVGPPWS